MTLLTRFPIPPACNSIIRSILTDEKWNRENHGNPDTCIKLFPSINRNEPTSNQSLDRPKPAPRKLIKINQHAQFPPTWKENCEYEPTQKRITRNWIVRLEFENSDRRICHDSSKDSSHESPRDSESRNAPPLFPKLIESPRHANRALLTTRETYSLAHQRSHRPAFIASNIAHGTFTFFVAERRTFLESIKTTRLLRRSGKITCMCVCRWTCFYHVREDL